MALTTASRNVPSTVRAVHPLLANPTLIAYSPWLQRRTSVTLGPPPFPLAFRLWDGVRVFANGGGILTLQTRHAERKKQSQFDNKQPSLPASGLAYVAC
jgi:hypothetical protein